MDAENGDSNPPPFLVKTGDRTVAKQDKQGLTKPATSRALRMGAPLAAAGVGLTIGSVVTWLQGYVGWETVVGVLGLSANLIMAIAAIGAFFLWRKQISGASQHATARAAVRCAHNVEISARRYMNKATDIRRHCAREVDSDIYFVVADLAPLHDALKTALDAVGPAVVDVRTDWDSDAALPLEQCWHFGEQIRANIAWVAETLSQGPKPVDQTAPDATGRWDWHAVVEGDSKAVALVGETLRRHLDAVDEWAAPHIGKKPRKSKVPNLPGAAPMTGF